MKPNDLQTIHPLLEKRWSPRAFAPQPIEEEKIEALFNAARWAASAMNEQPWRFIYALKGESGRYNKLFRCLVEFNREWVKTAPLLVMTLVKTNYEKNDKPNNWATHDLGLAIGNLTTQASALDLYVHNMGGFSIEKAKELFDLPPGLEPVTMIAAGYLGDPDQLTGDLRKIETAPRQRKPLNEIILDL